MQQEFTPLPSGFGGRTAQGFSLIELMVVVTILSLLLGLAMPRYGDYLDRTRRNDGRGALLELAAQQERLHFERNQYSASMADLWSGKVGDDFVSSEGFYTLRVTTADSGQEFTATATARGVQAGDVASAHRSWSRLYLSLTAFASREITILVACLFLSNSFNTIHLLSTRPMSNVSSFFRLCP